jgi:hypothetical protein
MSPASRFPALASRSDMLVPLLTMFCCCLPIGAFSPNLTTRKRLELFAAWVVMLAVGWALSTTLTPPA